MPEARRSEIEACLAPVLALAASRLRPRRVVLFGSQARGDAAQGSDIDLANEAPDISEDVWSRFVLDAQEVLACLKGLDLVRLDQAGEPLRTRIMQEGRELYSGGNHAEAS